MQSLGFEGRIGGDDNRNASVVVSVPHYGPLSQPPPRTAVAHINSGSLFGVQQGEVATFLGIPFAAPPVGPDRWRAPQPVKPWQGTRDASHFGASCYQALTPRGFGPWKHEFVVQGEAIHDLLVSPLAAGLFKRVIIQSGLPNSRRSTTLAEAEKTGADFAHSRNAASLESLRAVPPAELLGLAQARGPRFGPIVDGMLLPDRAERRAASGQFNDTPVMIGMVADEGSAFSPSYGAADKSGFTARERGLGALYAWGRERLSLGKQPIYVYMFAHVEPGPDSARYAAFHSSELPYAFRTFDKSPERNFTAADRALARVVSSYWVNFVKTGDPNGPGVPAWPRLAARDPQIMRLDVNSMEQPLLPQPRLQAMRDYLAHGGRPSLF